MFEDNKFGKVVKSLRNSRNQTQLEFALDLNISQSYLGKIERGVQNPTIDVAVAILNLCNKDFDYMNYFNEIYFEHSEDSEIIKNKIKIFADENIYRFLYDTISNIKG